MRELIRAVSEKLEIDRNEAELVVASLLSRPRFELYMNDHLDESEKVVLWSKVTQLGQGVPLEYITRRVQFRDLTLNVQPGVFIPRLETEYFIELIPAMMQRSPKRVLEIGTGCGAIAIALARIYPEAGFVATDISAGAIESARCNVNEMHLEQQISLVQCDAYEGIRGEFDLIVSNPPYIPSERVSLLPRSVRDFEPVAAIDGGEHGVRIIKRLILESSAYLGKTGVIALEIDEESVKVLRDFLMGKGVGPFKFGKDLFNKYRYLFIGALNEKSKDNR